MYDINNKQYVLKKKNGSIINIYYQKKHGILASSMTRDNNWAVPRLLVKNTVQGFSVCIDCNDIIHIAYSNLKGNIYYGRIIKDEFYSFPVLEGRHDKQKIKKIKLLCTLDSICICYLINIDNTCMLCCQTIYKNKAVYPNVICRLDVSSIPYSAEVLNNNEIYVFFLKKEQNKNAIFYSYTDKPEQWRKAEELVVSKESIINLKTCIYNNKMYLFYIKKTLSEFILCQKSFGFINREWSMEEKVLNSPVPFIQQSVFSYNDNLYITWIKAGHLYYTSYNKNKSKWEEEQMIKMGSAQSLTCFSYAANTNVFKCRTNCIPGLFTNGLRLWMIGNIYIGSQNLIYKKKENNVKAVSKTDTTEELSKTVSDLKKDNENIKKSISFLRQNQINIQKELMNLTVKKEQK